MRVFVQSIDSHRELGFERHMICVVGYSDASAADEAIARVEERIAVGDVVDIAALSEPVRDHISMLLIGAHR